MKPKDMRNSTEFSMNRYWVNKRNHIVYHRILGQFFFLALFLLTLNACQEATSIGNEIISGSNSLELVDSDTFEIVAGSYRDDSVFSVSQPYYVAGSMSDPVFGKTFAGIYFQPLPPANRVVLGEDLVLDSIGLVLKYTDVYGDKDYRPSFLVYRMRQTFLNVQFGGLYRENTVFLTDPEPIGYVRNVRLKTSDSSSIYIPLSRSLGEEILSQAGTSNFSSKGAFASFLHGFYLRPDTSRGYGRNMTVFQMNTSGARLVIHYRNAESDSLSLSFGVEPTSAVANTIKHQYTNPEILRQISGNPPAANAVYLQGMAGLAAKIEIPSFAGLKNAAINKAELIITVLPSDEDSLFKAPDRIVPRIRADSSSVLLALPDDEFDRNFPFYRLDGYRKKIMVDGKPYYQYRLNIARYLQEVALGNLSLKPIYLRAYPPAVNPGRAVIADGHHPNDRLKMRLRIIYTR